MKKTFKNIFGFKAFSVLLSLSLLLGALWCVPAFAEDEGTKVNVWDGKSADFNEGEGRGTEADPYKISNGGQLFKMMNDMGMDADGNALYYEMTNDVVLSSDIVKNQWIPEDPKSDQNYKFLGHLDGKGHKITRMYYDADYRTRVALIPMMGENSSVQNVNIIGAYIDATEAPASYASAITTRVLGTGVTVSNCYVDNTSIFKAKSKVAGLIARADNYAPKVENCAFAGELYCNGKQIKTGGIVKAAYGDGAVAQKTKIINCYSVGSFPVQPENYVHAINGFEFTNVYTDIMIDDVKSEIPDYPYRESRPANISDATAAKCDANLKKITTLTKAGMQSGAAKVNMTGFDFYTAWQAVENGYPVPRTTDCTEYEGKGTATEPYVISTDAQLYKLATDNDTAGKYYKLTADITLNDNLAAAAQWVTAGDYTTTVFRGNLDGNGKTVRGLYVNTSGDGHKYAGLFPVIGAGAVISKLTVKDTYLYGTNNSGDYFFGAIAGAVKLSESDKDTASDPMKWPTIVACGVEDATVNARFAGGIIGGGEGYAKIESSYSANVNLSTNASNIADGNVAANGIVGKSWNKNFYVKNCYTTYKTPYVSNMATNFYVLQNVSINQDGTIDATGLLGGTFTAVHGGASEPNKNLEYVHVSTKGDEEALAQIRSYLLGDTNKYIVDVNNNLQYVDICDLVYAALGE